MRAVYRESGDTLADSDVKKKPGVAFTFSEKIL
jgi:hypothetical protein